MIGNVERQVQDDERGRDSAMGNAQFGRLMLWLTADSLAERPRDQDRSKTREPCCRPYGGIPPGYTRN
jgi:hypothetical protein